jgi:hypothetical protein
LTNKFKIGDRVRLISRAYDSQGIADGTRGEVMEDSSCPFVAWDGLTSGHDGFNGDGSTNQWAVDQDHLEKLVPASTYLNGLWADNALDEVSTRRRAKSRSWRW